MSQTIYNNPFRAWSELLRNLHDDYLAAVKAQTKVSAPAGEVVVALAGLVSGSGRIAKLIDELEHKDRAAFEALQRAFEKGAKAK